MNEKRKTIKLILSNVKGYKADTALSIVFIVLEAVCECIIPFIMSKLLNALSNYALSGSHFDVMINYLIYLPFSSYLLFSLEIIDKNSSSSSSLLYFSS